MRRSAFIGCITTILILFACDSDLFPCSAKAQTASTGAPDARTAMTYNLKYASFTSTAPNQFLILAYGGTINTANGTNSITVSPATGTLYFRLSRP